MPGRGDGGPPEDAPWPEIEAWRGRQRGRLIKLRQSMPEEVRRQAGAEVLARIDAAFPGLAAETIGFTWPFKAEIDTRDFVAEKVAAGVQAALPVVVAKNRPLEFWRWQPGDPLDSGVLGIPIPARREVVVPSVLLAPLLGFDGAGYRLGYGGGYYDRTLASFAQRPYVIGLGFSACRLESIRPQPHDIAMDVIVTEAGLWRTPKA
ncbi:MAG: 5-formyltetrahydrofolate cyclo-ligase [Rhodovibrionaceae bacterium]